MEDRAEKFHRGQNPAREPRGISKKRPHTFRRTEGDEQAAPKRCSMSLYKEFSYPGYAWGMALDLSSCNGL